MDESILTKICSKCKIEKPVSEFSKGKNKDGKRSTCKSCDAVYRAENIERIKEYRNDKAVKARENELQKKRRAKNPEHFRKKARDYRKKNKDKINAQARELRKNNPEKYLKRELEYNKRHREERRLKAIAYRKENRDEIAKRQSKNYKKNKTKYQNRNKTYYQKNKEDLKKKQRIYYTTENGKISRIKNRHKYRSLKQNAIVEDFNPIEVFERDNYICQLCGCKTRPDFKNQYHPKYPNLDHIIPLSKGGEHSKQNTQCACHKCNMEKSNTGTGDQLRLFG